MEAVMAVALLLGDQDVIRQLGPSQLRIMLREDGSSCLQFIVSVQVSYRYKESPEKEMVLFVQRGEALRHSEFALESVTGKWLSIMDEANTPDIIFVHLKPQAGTHIRDGSVYRLEITLRQRNGTRTEENTDE